MELYNNDTMKRLIIAIVITLTFCLDVLAAGSTFKVRYFGTVEGLKSDRAVRVVQDTRGFYWFGTYRGLQRFDGHAFKEYQVATFLPGALVDFEVFKFFIAADSTLLAGTSIGLLRFDEVGNRFVHIPYANEKKPYRVLDICAIDDSTLFVSSFRHKGVCVSPPLGCAGIGLFGRPANRARPHGANAYQRPRSHVYLLFQFQAL